MKRLENDIFNGAKFLPTLSDLKKLAQSRGIPNKKFKDMRSEELSVFLNVPLISNPNYVEFKIPERISNKRLKYFSDIEDWSCGGCDYGACAQTTIRDTVTGEEFVFHSKRQAIVALGTESKRVTDSWGFQIIASERRYKCK